jgi:tripartite-type tricarboxylate transporter receptor subunit TctC
MKSIFARAYCFFTASLFIFFASGFGPANAQSGKAVSLPQTITIVFPFAAGGGGDVQTRLVARHLPKYLPGSTTFVVKNEPGAGGRAGVQTVYRSKADGTVMGSTYSSSAIGNQAVFGADTGYDFSKFVLLTSTYHNPYTLAVGPQTPYKSIADLKKAGRPIAFCSEGGTSLAYIVVAASEIGLPYRFIPGYRGAPDSTAGLLRGDCEAVSYGLEFTNRYLKEGVRPIAVHGAERHSLWPDVPTSKEQGYPLELMLDLVFYMPPGSPPEMADLLRDGLTKLYQNKEFLDAIRAAKFTPTFADTKETQRFVSGLTKLFTKYASELRDSAASIK